MKGFSLPELLIIITLASIILIAALFGQRLQLSRSFDAIRKSDLNKIKIALEHYFSDKGCYPPQSIFNTCGGTGLAPYLDAIPCDPESKQPYNIQLDGTACSQKYYLYGYASNANDPGITCQGKFYVASTNVPLSELLAICSGSTICKSGYYVCDQGICKLASQIEKPNCVPLFCEYNCQNSCGIPGFQVQPSPCTP